MSQQSEQTIIFGRASRKFDQASARRAAATAAPQVTQKRPSFLGHLVRLNFFSIFAASFWIVFGILANGGPLVLEDAMASPHITNAMFPPMLPFWGAFFVWLLSRGFARPAVLPTPPRVDPTRIALALVAAVIATLAWRFVLKVPMEAPLQPMFGAGTVRSEGWAPVWVVGPAAGIFVYALLGFLGYFWHRGRLRSAFKRVICVVIFAFFAARVVRNIGFVWPMPGTTVLGIIGILPNIARLALGNAANDVTTICGPALLPVSLAAATGIALVEGWHPQAAKDRATQWFDANVMRRLKPR